MYCAVVMDNCGELCKSWEAESDIRHFLRAEQQLIRWPKAEDVGVPSLKSLGLNYKVLICVAKWHAASSSGKPAKAPPVRLLKKEALHGAFVHM